AERARLRGAELLLIFGFWTLIAMLSLANILVEPPRVRGLSPLPSLPVYVPATMEIAEAYLWAALTPLIFWMARRFNIERANWIPHVLLLLVSGIAIAIAIDIITGLLRLHMLQAALRNM